MRVVPWAGVVAGIVMLWSSGADARVLLHHDLTSLVLLSDAIVLAERGGTHELADGLQVAEMRVRRVYMGIVAANSTIEVPDDAYDLDGTADHPLAGRSNDVVLFLVRSGRASPRWWIVASGVRVQVGGRVYRFEQHSNPGNYEPVPQGRDPLDVRDGITPDAPVDFATFEADLRAALVRSRAVSAAFAPTVGPPRREPRLALLPPVQDRVGGPGRGHGSYRDEVAYRVVESFVDQNDLDGALEALSRVVGDRPPLRGRAITAETLAQAALDRGRPPHRRIEALLSLWDPAPPAAAVIERVSPLLRDPLPEIRAAAVSAIAMASGALAADVRAAVRRSLAGAAATETDPLVRIALLGAGDRDVVRRLRGPAHAVVVRRRGEDVSVAAGWRGTDAPIIDLADVSAAGAACEQSAKSTWRAGSSGGVVARIHCSDPYDPWSVTVSVRSGRNEERQTFELR